MGPGRAGEGRLAASSRCPGNRAQEEACTAARRRHSNAAESAGLLTPRPPPASTGPREGCRAPGMRPGLWGLSDLEAPRLLVHRWGDGTELSCPVPSPGGWAPVAAKELWKFPAQKFLSSLCCWSDHKPRRSLTPTKQLGPRPPSQDSVWVGGAARSSGDRVLSWCLCPLRPPPGFWPQHGRDAGPGSAHGRWAGAEGCQSLEESPGRTSALLTVPGLLGLPPRPA